MSQTKFLHIPRTIWILLVITFVVPVSSSAQELHHSANVTTVFKSASYAYKDGILDSALMDGPYSLVVDSTGNIYVSDFRNFSVRKITPSGLVSTVVFKIREGSRSKTTTNISAGAISLALHKNNTLYLGTYGSVRKVNTEGYLVSVAESSGSSFIRPGTPNSIKISDIESMFFTPKDDLFIINGNFVKKITSQGVVVDVSGDYYSGLQDGHLEEGKFNLPASLVADSKGNLFIADKDNNCIRKIGTDNMVSTFAGTNIKGFKDGKGIDARFNSPAGLTIDINDDLYVCDTRNHAIRKVTPDGSVSTLAGGTFGYADGEGKQAKFQGPQSIYYYAKDNSFYICDTGNNAIRLLKFE